MITQYVITRTEKEILDSFGTSMMKLKHKQENNGPVAKVADDAAGKHVALSAPKQVMKPPPSPSGSATGFPLEMTQGGPPAITEPSCDLPIAESLPTSMTAASSVAATPCPGPAATGPVGTPVINLMPPSGSSRDPGPLGRPPPADPSPADLQRWFPSLSRVSSCLQGSTPRQEAISKHRYRS